MDYWVAINEHTYTISEPDPDDMWDQGEFGLDCNVVGISRSVSPWCIDQVEPSYKNDDISVGDWAYVVFVRYSTGSTFGREGAWDVACVKSSHKSAEEIEKLILSDDPGLDYAPWLGGFESLEDVEIVELQMR